MKALTLSRLFRKPVVVHTVRTVVSTPTRATPATLRLSFLPPTLRSSEAKTRMPLHPHHSRVSTGDRSLAGGLRLPAQYKICTALILSLAVRFAVGGCVYAAARGCSIVISHVYALPLCYADENDAFCRDIVGQLSSSSTFGTLGLTHNSLSSFNSNGCPAGVLKLYQ